MWRYVIEDVLLLIFLLVSMEEKNIINMSLKWNREI